MTVTAVSPRMRRMQWIAIGLATGAIALNYVDRSTLAIGNLPIRQEFGLNATAIGAGVTILGAVILHFGVRSSITTEAPEARPAAAEAQQAAD